MRRAQALLALPLVLALLALVAPVPAAADEPVKIQVIQTTKFTNLSAYMYDIDTKKLEPVNTSYVQVLDYELKDLNTADSYEPAVVLNLDAPTTDLNTNESIVYAYILTNAYGDSMLAAVADVNTTDNSITNIQYFKISPVSGDVAIIRTSYDIVVEGNGYKLSIPLANFTNPKVLLMTDGQLAVNSIQYVELRALRNPPAGFNLIRSGSGEAEFTISANGDMQVWFDETHTGGDLDLFVFDQSNPYYNQASLSQPWDWLDTHATTILWADTHPWSASFTAHGTVKFIVKKFNGDANAVSWRVAARLTNSPQPQPTETQPAQTTTPSQPSTTPQNWLSALGGSVSVAGYSVPVIVIVLLFIIAAALLLRR